MSGKNLFLRKVDLNLNKTILLTVLPIIILKQTASWALPGMSDRYSYLIGIFARHTGNTVFPFQPSRGWVG